MAAVAKEVIGRGGDSTESNRSIARPWFVTGAADEAEAIAAVATAAPGLVDGLILTGVFAGERVKEGFECEANYGLIPPRPPLVEGQSSFHFEVATQPQRIVIPLAPQTVYAREGMDPPSDSARWLIGQQGDGSPPEGAEVFEPIANFSETHIIGSGVVTAAHQRALLRIVGRLNLFSFRGWAAEEVMCTGVSGSQRGAEDWEISFRFGVREHQQNLTVAGIQVDSKKGWQFLWPRYRLEKDGSEPILSNHVEYIVVADVFRKADLGLLGIGN